MSLMTLRQANATSSAGNECDFVLKDSSYRIPFTSPSADSLAVLFVADVLHPIYDLPLKTFLNGDMGQSCPGRVSFT